MNKTYVIQRLAGKCNQATGSDPKILLGASKETFTVNLTN